MPVVKFPWMKRKHWLLLRFLLAMFALFALASGLHAVHFRPGRSLRIEPLAATQIVLSGVVQQILEIPLWKEILFLGMLVICMVLCMLLLSPEARKRLILQLIRFGLAVAIILFLIKNHLILLPSLNFNFASQGGLPLGSTPSLDFIPFQAPAMPLWMNYLVSFGVTLAFMTLMWIAYRFWIRFLPRRFSRPLDQVAAIAQSSLDDLVSGRQWEDVIIQSYIRMNHAVAATRGLQRAEAATPREFAARLEDAGLPADPVQRLTRLFESARYGARTSSRIEMDEAIGCLKSILYFCGVVQ